MCGIAGYYTANGTPDHSQIELMTKVLHHRGPDAGGHYVGPKTMLGHRRLSIIDLSDKANQPMMSHSGRFVAVFNGEIYNYREVAAELGIETRTTSDTEVVVEAFEKLGPQFVERLNGMFAIAICEIATQRIWLFRDRMGIKPLFYYLSDNVFAFASELKAIEQLDDFKRSKRMNKLAVNKFLQLGYIPAPDTIYENVFKFHQGHYAVFDGQHLTLSRYWNLTDSITNQPIKDADSALSTLQNLIESSVKYRLIADVPYGTLLSGGIDSSLVTAVARRLCGTRTNTFSIGFKDSQHDESQYSEQVARQLDTNHHLMMMTEQDAMERVADMFYFYDEPYADSSALPTMLVSQVAAQHVKMVLTGDGGDELFLGYGMYRWADRLANPLLQAARRPLYLASHLAGSRWQRIGKMFDWRSGDNLQTHIFSQEQYLFTAAETERFTQASTPPMPSFEMPTGCRMSAAEQQSVFDMLYYLPDDLLVKVDRASMRHSLESRVPLLDYRIVEFAVNLHKSLKMNGDISKYLLKQVLYKYLPPEIFNRPKWGFSVPLCNWLRTDLKYLTDKYLARSVVEQAQIVNYADVEQLLKRFYVQKIDYLYNRVWALICLHQWWVERFSK
ncbi:MAG: asparagine synthase (glutamine-hydrolyzing) [Salinivirgaceae bacterium]|nr:asparagine synthase (glutamine-hydrolyzing) [Salinivirgaceae bacterium]